MSIQPSDDGVVQGRPARKAWHRMSEFEKCLFWWTEINHFALRLHRELPSTPWLSLRFEDVFCGDAETQLARLVDFLGFPKRDGFIHSLQENTDRYYAETRRRIHPKSLLKYPQAVDTMEQLGYSVRECLSRESREELQSRYGSPSRAGRPWRGKARKAFGMLRRTLARVRRQA